MTGRQVAAAGGSTGTPARMTITITADAVEARIAELVEQAPPLTDRQRDRIGSLFGSSARRSAAPARKAA